MAGRLNFLFQVNPNIPRGQVGVRPAGAGRFHVMASEELTDAQVTMAIARFISNHEMTADAVPAGAESP